METTKTVISKSAKRKISSEVIFPVTAKDGTVLNKTVKRIKANDFTQQVVYRTKYPNGQTKSVTKHERIN